MDAGLLGRPKPAKQAEEQALGERDAARRCPDRNVEEDRRCRAPDDRAVVVVDDCEIAVLRRYAPERLAAAAEARTDAAGDMAEAVVGRRARILVPPVAAGEPVVAEAHARVRRDAVDGVPSRNVPVGVAPSPSRFAEESPLRPSRAVQGPATFCQQPSAVPRGEAQPWSSRAEPARSRAASTRRCRKRDAGGSEKGG